MDIIGTLRQYRIGPFTIFDTVLAYGAIFLLSPILTWLFSKINVSIPRAAWLWFVLPISVVAHVLVHQMTPFTTMVLDPGGSYIAKIVVLFMLFMGVRLIKIGNDSTSQ